MRKLKMSNYTQNKAGRWVKKSTGHYVKAYTAKQLDKQLTDVANTKAGIKKLDKFVEKSSKKQAKKNARKSTKKNVKRSKKAKSASKQKARKSIKENSKKDLLGYIKVTVHKDHSMSLLVDSNLNDSDIYYVGHVLEKYVD